MGHPPRKHGDEGHHMGIDAPAMLADAVPRHAQGRVIAALPSNDKAERVVLDTNDNLLDQRADDPFASCWRGARAVPGPLEISAEREQAIPVRGGQRRLGACCQCIPFILQRAHAQETLVPASLKFRRDEAVVRVDGIVLPPRTSGFVARLLEGEFDLAPLLRLRDAARLEGADRGLYAERLETLDHFGADSAINPQAAERDAPVPAMVEVAAPAVIAPGPAVRAAVGDMELAAAVAAAEQAGEQRFAAPHRSAAHEALAIGVIADQALVPLELGPANVALMVVQDQSFPGAAVLAKAAHDPLAAGLEGDAAAGAPEGVGAGIDRVRQHVVQGVVDRQLPRDAATFQAVADGGQRQALLAHPKENLPDRLQFGELGEDERDRLLDAPIRVLLDAVVRDLQVTDRDGEEELAAARFLLQGFEGALAEEREFHLAHGALHAQQQAVVRVAWIVDAIFVEDERANQAAELQQRVPVAAVAGEPRGLDRDHGADAALADGGEQLLEARPGDPGTGAAEIVVDHLDGGPSQRPGALDERILATAALVMIEHLIGGRLAHIDEGAAGQVVRRDLGHRRPPWRRSRAVPAGRGRLPPSGGSAEAGSAWPAARASGEDASLSRRTDPADCEALRRNDDAVCSSCAAPV